MTPTKRLEQEHEQILDLLTVLEHLARRVREGERPLPDLQECLQLLRTFADDAHHGKEERHLFPALNASGLPRHSGPVAVMLLEHDAGRSELSDMGSALIDLGLGEEEGAGRFARAASRYVGLLRDHIDKENDVLFPIACEILGADATEPLVREYAAVDVEVFGPDGYAKALERIAALVARTPRTPRSVVTDAQTGPRRCHR